MILFERRDVVAAALSSSLGQYQTPQGSTCLSLEHALQVIQDQCPTTFQRAVRASGGKFLYRGESVTCPTILQVPSDLLDPTTYNDPKALRFFTCLEEQAAITTRSRTASPATMVRPSNGHIGTARRDEAAQWGAPCTIWPLGQPFHYMWPHDSALFYPGSVCSSNNDDISANNFVVGTGLSQALRLEKEVMFTSPSFLVLPEMYEERVRDVILFGN